MSKNQSLINRNGKALCPECSQWEIVIEIEYVATKHTTFLSSDDATIEELEEDFYDTDAEAEGTIIESEVGIYRLACLACRKAFAFDEVFQAEE